MATGGAVAARLVGGFYLDVAHVYFLVHEEHGGPAALLAPVLGTGGLVDIDDFDLGAVVLEPLLAALVDDGHEVALAVVLVGVVGPVVVVAAVEDDPHEPVLAGGLGVLDGFEPELVVDVLVEEDVVEEVVLDFGFAELVDVWVGRGVRLMVWQKLGKRSSMW